MASGWGVEDADCGVQKNKETFPICKIREGTAQYQQVTQKLKPSAKKQGEEKLIVGSDRKNGYGGFSYK
jgi:hypothetical protein